MPQASGVREAAPVYHDAEAEEAGGGARLRKVSPALRMTCA